MKKLLILLWEMVDLNFNKDSKLVKIWFSAVLAGVYTREDVPALLNLRTVVYELLDEMGFPDGSN